MEKELLDTEKLWVQGELFYAYGFPRTDSAQVYGTQIVKGNAIFLRVVELNPEVFNESPPHPDETSHICLNWNPEEAQALMKTTGALSLPDGMSGSPLWNTRYEEITSTGGTWKASDARVTGMIWGHSAKAGQVYATPIALLKPLLW